VGEQFKKKKKDGRILSLFNIGYILERNEKIHVGKKL